MKNFLIFGVMGIFSLLSSKSNAQMVEVKTPVSSIYDININSLEGDSLDMSDYKGKKLLIVNVASKCGFTPQYKDLQELHETYGDDVTIIGVPCNQFMGQEPGDAEKIAEFCERNYGVTFQMTEKVEVKGKNQHPLYTWLTDKTENGSQDSTVKWNFQKYLVSENGELLAIFGSKVNPMSEEIQAFFK
jgi:glutathione peroxidase